MTRLAIGAAIVYALLFLGGMQSFSYTHKCVRSHIERNVDENGDMKVCDWYVMNGNRWDVDGPVQAVIHWARTRWGHD